MNTLLPVIASACDTLSALLQDIITDEETRVDEIRTEISEYAAQSSSEISDTDAALYINRLTALAHLTGHAQRVGDWGHQIDFSSLDHDTSVAVLGLLSNAIGVLGFQGSASAEGRATIASAIAQFVDYDLPVHPAENALADDGSAPLYEDAVAEATGDERL